MAKTRTRKAGVTRRATTGRRSSRARRKDDGSKRIGVLTGGGDCPGLNAVLRALVKTAVLNYGWEVVGIREGFEGLLSPGLTGPLGLAEVRGLLPRGGTILGSSNRGNPFEYKKVKGKKTVVVDISEKAMRTYKRLGLDALIVIGGDGSLKIAQRFYEKGMNVIGVPKTIDNDLMSTDATFGFRTAVMTATEAIDKLHTTAESHHRAMVVEVMGRYAGWIALESGLAGGADVILIPEIPYDIKKVCDKIRRRDKRGSHFSIIVVAEGAKPVGGDVIVLEKKKVGHGLDRLGGVGDQVGAQIQDITGMETRTTVLGHIQRGGTPTAFDRNLSTRFGVAAVNLVNEERFGRMVCYQDFRIESVRIEKAVGSFKAVDPDGELVRTAEAIGISFGR